MPALPAQVSFGRLLIQEAPELPPVLARNLVAEGGRDTRLTWADFVAFDEVRAPRPISPPTLLPLRHRMLWCPRSLGCYLIDMRGGAGPCVCNV